MPHSEMNPLQMTLIQKYINRERSRAVDHKCSSRLTQDSRSVVNQLTRVSFNSQVNAAFGF
jgi:hypothetical protein